ncbi:MAG: alpha-amylase family glycosyl hydrolase [Saprospiraceae bacterium]
MDVSYTMMGNTDQKPTNIKDTLPFDQPPLWAREAIWYQILIDRFYNGNPNNDPTSVTCHNALIDPFPLDWELTPWAHNWYEQESWAHTTALDFYRTIQMRRYGGDLQGVEDKIPYLKELGITAIYFNPVNDAPSLHKYDARYYHHIDITFGDDIKGDMEIMAREIHDDPSTWQWTSADLRFVRLVRKLHQEGIRVIIDFSWNHTGKNFWAFQDVEEKLDQSDFKNWYNCEFTKDEITGVVKMNYQGWIGISSLPELRKVDTQTKITGQPYEGNLDTKVKQHIYDVCKRWMDPNGDGSLEGGIDGMRLDVAEHIPLGFWRDFRKYVRSINPEFYLVGENWWANWPDELMDPIPWLKGDVFDAVMHYHWFKVSRGYFGQPEDALNITQLRSALDGLFRKHPKATQQALMNVATSHDTPRILTSLFNVNKYKYKCKPQEDVYYRTDQPGEYTYHRTKLLLLHQFTFVGAPHIWNGEEMGMLGADDPDNRKPLVWPELSFDVETQSEMSIYKYELLPAFNHDIFQYYKSIIALRKSIRTFIYGEFEMITALNSDKIFAYYRYDEHDKYMVLFNIHAEENQVSLPSDVMDTRIIFAFHFTEHSVTTTINMPPFSGLVLQIFQ